LDGHEASSASHYSDESHRATVIELYRQNLIVQQPVELLSSCRSMIVVLLHFDSRCLLFHCNGGYELDL
jgi:hypothetical protein